MIEPTRLPVLGRSVFYTICVWTPNISGSAWGADEARERVPRAGGDVGRVGGAHLDGPEVRFLEVDEEARDKDCCEAVWQQ